MKNRYFFLPLICGICLPSMTIFFLQVFVAGISPIQSIMDLIHRQFAVGHFLFFIMFFTLIPFVALIIMVYLISILISGRRLMYIFWSGFIPILILNLWMHFAVWYPLYAPGMHASSTSVLAFLFVPIYCLLILPFGLLIGWIISLASIRKVGNSGTDWNSRGQ